MLKTKWNSDSIETLDILLDYQNARIDANAASTQEEIRCLLLKTEKVIELAKSIIKNNGLMYGERIITIKENDKHMVLEGNRRTCACQLLLDPNLIPKDYKSDFPACGDELKNIIGTIKTDIAPDRLAAEITITKRHTEPGVEQWTPLAKQRRIKRLVDAGRSFDELVLEFGMEKPNILKTLKNYHIFNYAKNLIGWSNAEKKKLDDPILKISPFTRFFDLAGVRKTLDYEHDEKGELKIQADKTLFDKAILAIARELLLPNQQTGKKSADTRTSAEELFGRISVNNPELKKYLTIKKAKSFSATKATSTTSATKSTETASASKATSNKSSAKANIFFENLTCGVKDDNLLIVVKEISSINYNDFPLASSFLLRALIERVLNWCIDEYSLRKQLLKDFHTENPSHKRKEPGLDYIIDYCIKNDSKIFKVARMKSVLGQWKADKDLLDIIIHGNWAHPSVKTLEHLATIIRPTIEGIFSGDALIDIKNG